jgi:hypothetical protein
MPTIIKAGLYQPDPSTDEDGTMVPPYIYVDDEKIQILDEEDRVLGQFSYEELRGIMAIMAAEQEKQHLVIKAQIKNN